MVAKKVKCLRVAIDNKTYLKKLAAKIASWEIITPIEILIEINVNHNRCGVNHIEDTLELANLAKQIENSTGAIIFAGITGYEGHTAILPSTEKFQQTQLSHQILAAHKTALEEIGISVNVVSGGGTCNYIDCLEIGVLNEIQAGGGAWSDLLYYEKANLKQYQHKIGAFVLSQIISMPDDKSRAISDARFKSIGWHPYGGLPQPRDHDNLHVIGLSAEHAKIMSRTNGPINLNLGDKMILIPGYSDAMGFLHKEIYAIRNDHVEYAWKTLSA